MKVSAKLLEEIRKLFPKKLSAKISGELSEKPLKQLKCKCVTFFFKEMTETIP